jgi:outer membrane lipopolysaccharide assembly protein LptE/RlpB
VELIQGGIELIPPLPLNPFRVIFLNPLTLGNMFDKQGIVQGMRHGIIQQIEKKINQCSQKQYNKRSMSHLEISQFQDVNRKNN